MTDPINLIPPNTLQEIERILAPLCNAMRQDTGFGTRENRIAASISNDHKFGLEKGCGIADFDKNRPKNKLEDTAVKLVAEVALKLASNPKYLALEAAYHSASDAYKNYSDYLIIKYSDEPGDAAKAGNLNGINKMVDPNLPFEKASPKEKAAFAVLKEGADEASAVRYAYVERIAGEMGVEQNNKIFVQRALDLSYIEQASQDASPPASKAPEKSKDERSI